jgi:hypothetical protein
MDIKLDCSSFITGENELKQTITVLLTNYIGSMYQSTTLGAKFSVHDTDITLLEEGIRNTLEELEDLEVNGVQVVGTEVYVSIVYDGKVINYQYDFRYAN